MNRTVISLSLGAWAGVAALLVPTAIAAALTIRLPQETATLRTSNLPGYAVAVQKCTICHSADYVQYQPPGMSLDQWTAEMGKMQHAYGAPIGDVDVKLIGAYLAVAYGSAHATDAGVIAASASAETDSADASAAAPASGPMALLTSSGCLACHALDKKLVGPAYHDVAQRYRGDPQALAKIEATIRQGSSGKWGSIPMPPFTTLNETDATLLADFILKQ